MYFTVFIVVLMNGLTRCDRDATSQTVLNAPAIFSSSSHDRIVASYFQTREQLRTSIMGAILLKLERVFHRRQRDKTFLVYVYDNEALPWWLNILHFTAGTADSNILLGGCSVRNCNFTADSGRMEAADAVLVILDLVKAPRIKRKNFRQKWVFMARESPPHTACSHDTAQLANLFNWSMTYRTDSDVPVPYGRVLPLVAPVSPNVTRAALARLVPHWPGKQRSVVAAALVSNCAVPRRMRYLRELQRYIHIRVYGGCTKRWARNNLCPRYGKCTIINKYIFYLAFENSVCRQYITEKSFFNSFENGAIPVIMGATVQDCSHLLPPGSFLHVDNYGSPKNLAQEMKWIMASDDRILQFHTWRNHFEVSSETEFAGSSGASNLCRLCEALNYNSEEHKVYDQFDVRMFLDYKWNCRNNDD